MSAARASTASWYSAGLMATVSIRATATTGRVARLRAEAPADSPPVGAPGSAGGEGWPVAHVHLHGRSPPGPLSRRPEGRRLCTLLDGGRADERGMWECAPRATAKPLTLLKSLFSGPFSLDCDEAHKCLVSECRRGAVWAGSSGVVRWARSSTLRGTSVNSVLDGARYRMHSWDGTAPNATLGSRIVPETRTSVSRAPLATFVLG